MNKNDIDILWSRSIGIKNYSLKKVRNESTHPGEFICSECGAKTKLATVTRDGEHPSEPSYCPNCGREVKQR